MTPADCKFQPMDQAIKNEGASSKSISLEVCVDKDNLANPPPEPPGGANLCDRHIVTTADAVGWTPNGLDDFNATIWNWVQTRLADPPPGPAPTSGTTLGVEPGWAVHPQWAGDEDYMEAVGGPSFLTIAWCAMQQSEGAPYNFTYPDAVLAASQGRPLYIKIDTGHCWATYPSQIPPDPNHPNDPSEMVKPQYVSDYTAFVQAIVQRYSMAGVDGHFVHEFGIQNEPTDTSLWGGTLTQLETLSETASIAIHGADPNAKVTDWGMASPTWGAGIAERLLNENLGSAAVDAFNAYFEWRQDQIPPGLTYPVDLSGLTAFMNPPALGSKWLAYLNADHQLLTPQGPGQSPTFDVRQIHFYEPPNNVSALMDYLHATTPQTTPIEAFEVGQRWPGAPSDQQIRTDTMVESVTRLATGGVSTALWLPLRQPQAPNPLFGLTTSDGTWPPSGGPANAYKTLSTIVKAPALTIGTTHLTGGAFVDTMGGTTLVVWSNDGSDQPVTLPGVTSATTDTGAPLTINNDTFTVGATPVYVTTTVPPAAVVPLLP